MNRERLLKLAEFLSTVPAAKFDMRTWRGGPEQEAAAEADGDDCDVLTDELLQDTACGTTGCAVGWACVMPEFQAEGLYWDNCYGAPAVAGFERFEHYRNAMEVPAKFFGISRGVADFLFMPKYYPDNVGPMEVARRIQAVTEMTPEQLETI